MKAILANMVKEHPNMLHKRSESREYLQSRILLALQNHGAFVNWAFVGGTALRFLFGLPRYSEDLDFSLSAPKQNFQFQKIMRSVKAELESEAYDIEIKLREKSAVVSAWIKFKHVLYDIGISPHADETLAIKLEVDTTPPVGAQVTATVIRRFSMLHLLHYDKSSLFAGKLNAILTRKYTKGRDLYDLVWYLSAPAWPAPNLVQLNNALLQFGWQGEKLTEKNWKSVVLDRLKEINWKQAEKDVLPFLEKESDINMIKFEHMKMLLQ